MTPTAPQQPAWRSVGRRLARIPRFLGSIPVTLLTVGLLLLTGILTGTLFTATDPEDPSIIDLQFGLPAFRDGRIWTLFTGAVTFSQPVFYLVVGVLLAAGLGLYERRVGSLRAAVALVITHTAGIVIPALLLWPFVGSDWTWAAQLGGQLDAGMSAGGFGVAAAATALIAPPWRGRLRVVGSAVLLVLVIRSGLLWDLEHLAGWATGLAVGPWLGSQVRLARGHRTEPAPAAQVRVLTALIAAAFAVTNVVESFSPGLGGVVGPGLAVAPARGGTLIMLELVISLLIAGSLRRPHALPWWVALVGVSAIVVNSLLNTPMLPRIGDAVCAAILFAVLLWNRRAWPWRTDRSAVRPLVVLACLVVVFAAATSIAIWLARDQFEPAPGVWEVAREALARFTFTIGPAQPTGPIADTVIAAAGICWATILIGWLGWALWLSVPGRRVETTLLGDVDPASAEPTSSGSTSTERTRTELTGTELTRKRPEK
ncbi:MAG: hypothetical protein ABWZ98_08680 [Nakamurella sp.]